MSEVLPSRSEFWRTMKYGALGLGNPSMDRSRDRIDCEQSTSITIITCAIITLPKIIIAALSFQKAHWLTWPGWDVFIEIREMISEKLQLGETQLIWEVIIDVPDLIWQIWTLIWAEEDLSCRWRGIGGSTAYKYKHQFVAPGAHTCGYLFGYGVLLSGVLRMLCSRCLDEIGECWHSVQNLKKKLPTCERLDHSVSKGKILKTLCCSLGLGPISAWLRTIIKKRGNIRATRWSDCSYH